MNPIIINADDFGLTSGVSRAIAELLDCNAISNTTIMICIEGAAASCKEFLGAGISKKAGVHLQITPEEFHKTPLSPPADIPSLVDSSGEFKPRDHGDWINPAEVKLEWSRQIEKVGETLGHTPSHLDSHHGCHRYPELTPVYLELAKHYQIPVRGGQELGQIDSSAYGVDCSALAISEWTGRNKDLTHLKHYITEHLALVDSKPLELVVHPGFCDEDLMSASAWNTVRENDYEVLKSLAKENWLKENSIHLLGFEEL